MSLLTNYVLWAGLDVTQSGPIVHCDAITLAVPAIQTHLSDHM